MEVQKEEKIITEEGRETPVPVGTKGGQAGLLRPSSSDCLTSIVGNQAMAEISITGTAAQEAQQQNVPEPFQKKGKIGHSPKRGRCNSLPDNILYDLPKNRDEETAREKRKRETTPEKGAKEKMAFMEDVENEYKVLKELSKKIADELDMVKSVIKEIPNTKKEIKNAIKKLDGYANRMPKAVMVMAEALEELKKEDKSVKREKPEERRTERNAREMGSQTADDAESDKENLISQIEQGLSKKIDEEDMERLTELLAEALEELKKEDNFVKRDMREELRTERNTREIGTQTADDEERDKEKLISQIEVALSKELHEEDTERLIELPWPEEVFKKCRRSSDGEVIEDEVNTIIITKEREKDLDNMVKRATDRNQRLAKILGEDNLEAGKFVGAKTVNEIMTEQGEPKESTERYTYAIATAGFISRSDKTGFRENLEQIVKTCKRLGSNRISCVATKQVDLTSMKKCLELIGRKQDLEIVLYGRKEPDEAWGRVKKRKDEDVLIVKPLEGTSYTDIIKNMKEKVNTEGIVIDKINKTSNGNIQIKIQGKEEKSRRLFKDKLTDKLGGVAKVHTKERAHTFMILDIDETVTTDDVKEVLKKETKSEELEELQIRLAAKTNERGIKYAFVTIKEDQATLIKYKKRIGDGWNRWRIREVDNVIKCYRCQKVGHVLRECKEKQEDTRCYKCGESGHIKRDCKGKQTCYLCKIEGHKADSMRCPEYRKMQKERKMLKRGSVVSI